MMVARYYYPRLRWQMILYPLVSIVVFVLFKLLYDHGIDRMAVLLLGILGYMVEFAPLVLALRDDSELDAGLPACGLEKYLFLLGYFLVAIPLLVFAPSELLSLIFYGELDQQLVLSQAGVTLPEVMSMTELILGSVSSTISIILTCLWVVLANRTHRVLKGILFPIIVSLAVGIVGGIGAVIIMIAHFGDINDPSLVGDAGAVGSQVLILMKPILNALTVVMVIYSVIAAVMLWRTVTRRQV